MSNPLLRRAAIPTLAALLVAAHSLWPIHALEHLPKPQLACEQGPASAAAESAHSQAPRRLHALRPVAGDDEAHCGLCSTSGLGLGSESPGQLIASPRLSLLVLLLESKPAGRLLESSSPRGPPSVLLSV
ncbi:MAG TPA: hypothetical protein PK413_15610 [Thermoanaerobaculia bacterium]|nr:hypothetical protein [Thermoanaerobaculia bacterium]